MPARALLLVLDKDTVTAHVVLGEVEIWAVYRSHRK